MASTEEQKRLKDSIENQLHEARYELLYIKQHQQEVLPAYNKTGVTMGEITEEKNMKISQLEGELGSSGRRDH